MTLHLLTAFAAIVVAGVLVGMEFSGWAVVHRALNAIAFEANRPAEQAIYRGYGRIMPAFMPLTVGLVAVALLLAPDKAAPGFWLLTLALVGFLVMLGITLFGNMPINRQIEAATPDIHPERWWALRARWDRLHRYRVPVELAAFSALVAGALLTAQVV